MPEWIMREYLARRGAAKWMPGQIRPARCALLGYALHQFQVEGRFVSRWFLQVNTQPEVGNAGYDAGALQLYDFFDEQIALYESEDLNPLGRRIIECFRDRGTVEDYAELIPQVGLMG